MCTHPSVVSSRRKLQKTKSKTIISSTKQSCEAFCPSRCPTKRVTQRTAHAVLATPGLPTALCMHCQSGWKVAQRNDSQGRSFRERERKERSATRHLILALHAVRSSLLLPQSESDRPPFEAFFLGRTNRSPALARLLRDDHGGRRRRV